LTSPSISVNYRAQQFGQAAQGSGGGVGGGVSIDLISIAYLLDPKLKTAYIQGLWQELL